MPQFHKSYIPRLFVLCVTAAVACAQAADDPVPVGQRLTQARSSDGRFISWYEHMIDGPQIAQAPINGGDGLAMADLDKDGYEDIVSVHESDTRYDGVPDGHIRVAFGSDDPHQWELGTLVDGQDAGAPEDVSLADLNGDGYLDVIVACELSHLVYVQNPGKNGRTKPWKRLVIPVTRDRGSYIKAYFADFNADGRPEVVAANKGAQSPSEDPDQPKLPISIFKAEGDPLEGSSWTEYELGRYIIPQNAHPVDLDGDGDMDVVGGSRGEGRMMWFENTGGDGLNFTEHRIELDRGRASGFNLTFADINHDQKLDIVTAALTSAGIYLVWLEQSERKSGVWKLHEIGTIAPDSMTGFNLADINGDGKLDAIGGSYSRGPRDQDGDLPVSHRLGRISWFEQADNPEDPWIRHDISRRIRGMFDEFEARDMDGDGDMDFVSTRGNSGEFDGVFWLEQVRTANRVASFRPARHNDSREVSLPVE